MPVVALQVELFSQVFYELYYLGASEQKDTDPLCPDTPIVARAQRRQPVLPALPCVEQPGQKPQPTRALARTH